ncbi:plexin domain-containing protein [Ditylenchus destructor]|nr:plexin domain-containing protein [Ditylenchus destructor]
MRPRWYITASIYCYCILFEILAFFPESEATSLSSFHYDSALPYSLFVPLRRRRREADEHHTEAESVLDMQATLPPDLDKEDENQSQGTSSSEHTYYNMSIKPPADGLMDKYYLDMAKWLNESGVNGSTSHEHLDNSYRKAAAVKFNFLFPFYGHELTNMTIATGGFIYVGDQTHSWLAATQYIAPLMANFDTLSNDSAIMYGSSQNRMVVEWSKVRLKDNRAAGPFTFQVSLFKNGDIWFVYKDVPLSPQNISDLQHPCKLGISDAYLFNHKVPANSEKTSQPGKRVIHEYHRISILPEKIISNMVVELKALPNCLNFKSCQNCSTSSLKYFRCSWCDPKDTNGNAMKDKGFCSDLIGLNRRRQEWVEGSCADDKRQVYCDATEAVTVAENVTMTTPASQESTAAASTAESQTEKPKKAATKAQSINKEAKEESGGSGFAFFTMLLIVIGSSVAWVAYAYTHPHSPSGQFLIKYRPSKWQVPSSHVRYSASVHM